MRWTAIALRLIEITKRVNEPILSGSGHYHHSSLHVFVVNKDLVNIRHNPH